MICDAKVGLLSQMQVNTYADILQNHPLYVEVVPPSPSSSRSPSPSRVAESMAWWAATWYTFDHEGGWANGLSGNYYANNTGLNGTIIETVETNYTVGHYVRPAIYLHANTQVFDGNVFVPQNEIQSFTVDQQLGFTVFSYETQQITLAVRMYTRRISKWLNT